MLQKQNCLKEKIQIIINVVNKGKRRHKLISIQFIN